MAKSEENKDIKFDRDELLSDDLAVADKAREKRNSPLPEQFRDDPSKAVGYPIPEDRKPAVMLADKEGDHDYQLATYKGIENRRKHEATDGTGSVAAASLAANLDAGDDANEVQAPPTNSAKTAAKAADSSTGPGKDTSKK